MVVTQQQDEHQSCTEMLVNMSKCEWFGEITCMRAFRNTESKNKRKEQTTLIRQRHHSATCLLHPLRIIEHTAHAILIEH